MCWCYLGLNLSVSIKRKHGCNMNFLPHGVYVFVQVGTLRLGLGTESVILESVDKVRYTSIGPHKGTHCYLACLSRVPAFFYKLQISCLCLSAL